MEQLTPSEVETYKNFFVVEHYEGGSKENYLNKVKTMDGIFNIIVLISMSLCFFSLSSSMSSNIFDQSKEICVLRSYGVKKFQILKVYIYEALILVLSCSVCGFCIGVLIGNIMILQQSLLQSTPFFLVLPYKQFQTIVCISIFCAFGSTWSSARSILRMSIPDI